MTVREAAERLEISEGLCYQLIAEERLGHLRIGAAGSRGKIVIWEEHLESFISKCEVRPESWRGQRGKYWSSG